MTQLKPKRFMSKLCFLLIFFFVLLMVAGCLPDSAVPPEISQYNAEWPIANRDYSNSRATNDASINSQNVSTLGIAWSFDLPWVSEWGAAATNPLILDDIVYLQDLKSNVYAINLRTGNLIWKRDYNLDNFGPNGPAVGWDKLFAVKGYYGIAALDLKNGNELWSTRLSTKETVGIDIQLIVYDKLIFVSTVPGTSNVNFYTGGGAGIIYALDQETGEVRGSLRRLTPRIFGVIQV